MTPRLLLTWSLRDLRARWVQVVTIALVIGLGTGSFAAFNSMTAWRIASNEASFEATRMYDLRVDLSDNSFVPQGQLTEAIQSIPSASVIEGVEERLSVPTQVKAAYEVEDEDDGSTRTETVLVPGLLIGMDFSDPAGISVNRLHLTEGRELGPPDAGELTVLLEHKFALAYNLPPQGEALIAGGHTVNYVGHVLAPEYFIVLTEGGGFFAHASYAVVFASLETVQDIADRPGVVDEALIRISDDASRDRIIGELEQAIGGALPRVGFHVAEDMDDPAYRAITEDVESDQQTTNIIAFALFIGAVFAAFNLTSRMVETQRREIGVAMALGVTPRQIALRPFIVGGQIAVAGIIFWPHRWLASCPDAEGSAQRVHAPADLAVAVPVRDFWHGDARGAARPVRRRRLSGVASSWRQSNRRDPHGPPGGARQADWPRSCRACRRRAARSRSCRSGTWRARRAALS